MAGVQPAQLWGLLQPRNCGDLIEAEIQVNKAGQGWHLFSIYVSDQSSTED